MKTIERRKEIIERVFAAQDEDGFWKRITEKDKGYPQHLHYVPAFRATLWSLILLAELKCNREDPRIKKPFVTLKNHFFDAESGIYSLGQDHYPIPCLNGNMLYLDGYFNGGKDLRNMQVLAFFHQNQRFDDGEYDLPKNPLCSNTSCYGKHSCYWGIVKLMKGISFIPEAKRSKEARKLLDKCIRFVLLHKVCFSSHHPGKVMIKKIEWLTFPNMYKSDFLEILWLLKREKVHSSVLSEAIQLLQSKQHADGNFNLEREVHRMTTSVGRINEANPFITERAREVLDYYS